MQVKPFNYDNGTGRIAGGCKVIHVDWEAWAVRASGNMAKMLGPKCFLEDAPAIKFTPPSRLQELSEVLDSPVLPGMAEWLEKRAGVRR